MFLIRYYKLEIASTSSLAWDTLLGITAATASLCQLNITKHSVMQGLTLRQLPPAAGCLH